MIRSTVSVAIFEPDEAVGGVREETGRETGGPLLIELGAVLDFDRLEVLADQLVRAAQVRHALPETVRFRDEEPAFPIKAEAARIFDKGKLNPGVRLEVRMTHGSGKWLRLVFQRRQLRLRHGGQRFVALLQFRERHRPRGRSDKEQGSDG